MTLSRMRSQGCLELHRLTRRRRVIGSLARKQVMLGLQRAGDACARQNYHPRSFIRQAGIRAANEAGFKRSKEQTERARESRTGSLDRNRCRKRLKFDKVARQSDRRKAPSP